MTTTHEFARQLLSLEDAPLLIPRVKEYDESGDLQNPVTYKQTVEKPNNKNDLFEAYVLSYPVCEKE